MLHAAVLNLDQGFLYEGGELYIPFNKDQITTKKQSLALLAKLNIADIQNIYLVVLNTDITYCVGVYFVTILPKSLLKKLRLLKTFMIRGADSRWKIYVSKNDGPFLEKFFLVN